MHDSYVYLYSNCVDLVYSYDCYDMLICQTYLSKLRQGILPIQPTSSSSSSHPSPIPPTYLDPYLQSLLLRYEDKISQLELRNSKLEEDALGNKYAGADSETG